MEDRNRQQTPALSSLRYALTPREYELVYKYLLKRAPQSITKRTPKPDDYTASTSTGDEYHVATTRSALRVFLTVGVGLKSWDLISTKLLSSRTTAPKTKSRVGGSLVRSPTLRLALSLSSLLYLHRLLHRFFLRLRLRLLAEKAEQLRRRYPYLLQALTSRYAPAIGASLAGFSLAMYPKDQLRVTMTIYAGARALEFLYNAFEAEGYFKNKPDWLGSWLLFPLAQGQLLYAFVFDRDCFPKVMISPKQLTEMIVVANSLTTGIWRFHSQTYTELHSEATCQSCSNSTLARYR